MTPGNCVYTTAPIQLLLSLDHGWLGQDEQKVNLIIPEASEMGREVIHSVPFAWTDNMTLRAAQSHRVWLHEVWGGEAKCKEKGLKMKHWERQKWELTQEKVELGEGDK